MTKPKFNRTNRAIEWALWSWNPITGCLHGCEYCYARDIAERFYPQKFLPTFHADRLAAPGNTRRPSDELIASPFDPVRCRGGIGDSTSDPAAHPSGSSPRAAGRAAGGPSRWRTR